MMKPDLKTLVAALHKGGYLTLSGNPRKGKLYKLMDNRSNSLAYCSESLFNKLKKKENIKKAKIGYVICRSGILRLHGKCKIKKQYKHERNSI